MVLTQHVIKVRGRDGYGSFHTTMVLTQLHTRSFHSLPHLRFPYHYGSYATHLGRKAHFFCQPFPYHYGSYATKRHGYIIRTKKPRFHTTMVLTQLIYLIRSLRCNLCVSIPLWFLRNRKKQPIQTIREAFPYHYGSYATGARPQAPPAADHVSIPLWFLRNTIPEEVCPWIYTCFHTTMVLTQPTLIRP